MLTPKMVTRPHWEYNNIFWQPFATSTPLKTIPFQLKDNDVEKNKLTKTNIAVSTAVNNCYKSIGNVQNKQTVDYKVPSAKKFRKNRSSFYFDVASSDEDEQLNDSNKKPEIKINLENITKKKSSLKIKKAKVELIKQSKDAEIPKKKKNIKGSSKNSKNNISSPKKGYNKTRQAGIRPNKSTQNSDVNFTSKNLNSKRKNSSNEEGSQILPVENDKENVAHKIKVAEENKNHQKLQSLLESNYIRNKNNVESSECKESKNELNDSKLKESISQMSKNLILKDVNCSLIYSKGLEKSNREIQPDSRIISSKRKGSKLSKIISPTKKIKRKRREERESSESNKEAIENHLIGPLIIKKNNLAHQLFSDSKEQELINSLDLTTGEIDRIAEDSVFLGKLKQNKSHLTPKTTHAKPKADLQISADQNEKKTRPTRQRRPRSSGKFLLSGEQSVQCNCRSNVLKKKQESFCLEACKSQSNNDDNILIAQSKLDSENNESFNSNKILEVEVGRKIQNGSVKNGDRGKVEKCYAANQFLKDKNELTENEDKGSTTCVTNSAAVENKTNNLKQKKHKENLVYKVFTENTESKLKRKGDSDVKEKPAGLIVNENRKSNAGWKASSSSIPDVFKQINQLSSFEVQPGCLTTECWSLRNFKCGIFKVNCNSELSSKTMYHNSYFGAVLVKGNLKMKIGMKELELKEGDMAFVPPLTEWFAFNVYECEAVAYYWCGRF